MFASSVGSLMLPVVRTLVWLAAVATAAAESTVDAPDM